MRLTDQQRDWAAQRSQDAIRLLWGSRRLRWWAKLLPADDAESEALVALCIAAYKYDPLKVKAIRDDDGGWVALYVDWCRSRLQNAVARWRNRKFNTFEEKFTVVSATDYGESYYDKMAVEDHDRLDAQAVAAWIDRLPPREAYIVRRHLIDNQSLTDIAREVGLSRARCGHITQKAKAAVRRRFPDLCETDGSARTDEELARKVRSLRHLSKASIAKTLSISHQRLDRILALDCGTPQA